MHSSYRPGPQQLRVLRAIAVGYVVRDDLAGTRRGMWQTFRLGDDEVGMTVRSLARVGLVDAPLVGPPTITADGWTALRNASV